MQEECEACRKNRATLHFTTVADGKVVEKHLCEACARTAELGFPFVESSGGWQPPEEDWLPEEEKRRLVCPSCRHINQENWNFCSSCGAMREP